jgi:hypothetical protein
MGEIVPFMCMEALPGDKWKIRTEIVTRFAPIIFPIFHKINVYMEYFYTPNRLLWDGWGDFIWNRDDTLVPPYFDNWNGLAASTNGDYLGLPLATTDATMRCSALPFAALKKIWYDWYRDQNLQPDTTPLYNFEPCIDGDNTATTLFLDVISAPRKRAWNHDYFTSALPFAQKGDAALIPLTSEQKIQVELDPDLAPALNAQTFRSLAGVIQAGSGDLTVNSGNLDMAGVGSVVLAPDDNWIVNVNSEAQNIATLRLAFKVQEWLEKNARGGTRDIEGLQIHFGVKSPDARLQRSEYIGGTVGRVTISEVLSNASTNLEGDLYSPVGDYAGHAKHMNIGDTFSYYCYEHGFIIGQVSIRPETAYSQGLSRMWSREDVYDYYWATFQHIGEQAILNKEIYAYGLTTEDTFGYIPRYAEYKFENNRRS